MSCRQKEKKAKLTKGKKSNDEKKGIKCKEEEKGINGGNKEL